MKSYTAPECRSFDDSHTVLLKFQYGEHRAEVTARMGGNCYGGSILSSFVDLENGLTACLEDGKNKEHCLPYDGEDGKNLDIEYIIFTHSSRESVELDLEDAQKYLIGIEIIEYHQGADRSKDEPKDDDESEDDEPEEHCCEKEKRSVEGGCKNCGDPAL